jgi:hypothetical protein
MPKLSRRAARLSCVVTAYLNRLVPRDELAVIGKSGRRAKTLLPTANT